MATKSRKSAAGSERAKGRTSDLSKRTSVKQRRSIRSAGEAAGVLGQLKEPKSPMPAQHQPKPGLESKVSPRPRYKASHYQGADKLKQKVALITGGDSGIGRAVAVLFAREGADVAFTYLPEEEGDARETIQAIEQEGRTGLSILGDIRDREFCGRAIKQAVARL